MAFLDGLDIFKVADTTDTKVYHKTFLTIANAGKFFEQKQNDQNQRSVPTKLTKQALVYLSSSERHPSHAHLFNNLVVPNLDEGKLQSFFRPLSVDAAGLASKKMKGISEEQYSKETAEAKREKEKFEPQAENYPATAKKDITLSASNEIVLKLIKEQNIAEATRKELKELERKNLELQEIIRKSKAEIHSQKEREKFLDKLTAKVDSELKRVETGLYNEPREKENKKTSREVEEKKFKGSAKDVVLHSRQVNETSLNGKENNEETVKQTNNSNKGISKKRKSAGNQPDTSDEIGDSNLSSKKKKTIKNKLPVPKNKVSDRTQAKKCEDAELKNDNAIPANKTNARVSKKRKKIVNNGEPDEKIFKPKKIQPSTTSKKKPSSKSQLDENKKPAGKSEFVKNKKPAGKIELDKNKKPENKSEFVKKKMTAKKLQTGATKRKEPLEVEKAVEEKNVSTEADAAKTAKKISDEDLTTKTDKLLSSDALKECLQGFKTNPRKFERAKFGASRSGVEETSRKVTESANRLEADLNELRGHFDSVKRQVGVITDRAPHDRTELFNKILDELCWFYRDHVINAGTDASKFGGKFSLLREKMSDVITNFIYKPLPTRHVK